MQVNEAIANVAKHAVLARETLFVTREGVRTSNRKDCVSVQPVFMDGKTFNVLLNEHIDGEVVRQVRIAPQNGRWYVA